MNNNANGNINNTSGQKYMNNNQNMVNSPNNMGTVSNVSNGQVVSNPSALGQVNPNIVSNIQGVNNPSGQMNGSVNNGANSNLVNSNNQVNPMSTNQVNPMPNNQTNPMPNNQVNQTSNDKVNVVPNNQVVNNQVSSLPNNQMFNNQIVNNQINGVGVNQSNGVTNTQNNPNVQVSSQINPNPNPNSSSNNIKIEETSVTKSQKGTVTVATVNDGAVSVLTDKFPEPIDISVKASKVVTKNGKKVRIMTKRELITNIVLSFFFVLALCGVGYGTYYYIFRNNPRNFETKNVTVELGEEIPQSVRSYINLTDISEPDYSLDLSGVKNEIGTYTYKVSYGNTTKTGTITVNDTKAPVITFKDVKDFDSGTVITKDMLVLSCEDISECSYELTSPVDTSNVGEVTASITAKDNLGNSADYTIDINILEKLTKLICSKSGIGLDENSKMMIENNNYTLLFTGAKALKKGTLLTTRTYLSETDYTSIKDNLQASGYILEEENKKATKTSEIDNVANLTNQDEVKTHLESNGYICNISED